jgi:hypothetical protein
MNRLMLPSLETLLVLPRVMRTGLAVLLTAFVRTVLTTGLALLLMVTAIPGGTLLAEAAPAPSTAQSAPSSSPAAEAESEGGLLDNIREKLNLDEPLPESTKLFFKQVQGEDVEVEEPRPSGKDNQPLQ